MHEVTEFGVLLADDGSGRLAAVRDGLESEGIPVRFVRGGHDVLKALREERFSIVALPERLDETLGATLLRKGARRGDDFLPVLITEAKGSGAYEDLPHDAIILPIENASEITSTLAVAYRQRLRSPALDRIVGETERIRQIKQVIRQVAPTKLNILVTGESGTGKELVAQAIHESSPRRGAPFVAVNAGAIPEGVLESELFGHEKGSFTGAHAMRAGRFELADKGTLFLDEIGEMPQDIQVKLLRVLEESRFLRVGGTRSIEVDVRLITATNRNLEQSVEAGRFRHDLYFRLNVINIEVPPLRERRADVPLLAAEFVRRVARENDLRPIQFNREAIETLTAYHWPGNIRELRNVIEKIAVLYAGREIGPQNIEEALGSRFRRGANLPVLVGKPSEEADRELVYRTLLALRAEVAEIRALLARSGILRGERSASAIAADAPVRTVDGAPLSGDIGYRGVLGEEVSTDLDAEEAIISESDSGFAGNAGAGREDTLSLAELERDAIVRALRRTRGNRRRAAALLGMGERTLYRKLHGYGLVKRTP
ncbi:MAG: sigma-54 dependent transcriptional regulator [bacterium]